MKLIPYALIAIVSSAFTAWMFNGGHFVGPARQLNPPSFEFSYSDFISAMLTILALVLAALAIGIGVVAFRTIKEIKEDAARLAKEHAHTEIERALKTIPDRVNSNVAEQVIEQLPKAIEDRLENALENAGKAGILDDALEKAMAKMSFGGGMSNKELDPKFEKVNDEGDNNG